MGLNIKAETRQRQETLMNNHCLIRHRWNDVEERTVSDSSKFCVNDMKEKSVTFCFLKLKAIEKANFSKIPGGRVTFL